MNPPKHPSGKPIPADQGSKSIFIRNGPWRLPSVDALAPPRPAEPEAGARAFLVCCGRGYGLTELTDVPQLARASLVPPQVASVSVKSGGAQFGYWMYWVLKKIFPLPGSYTPAL